MTVGEKIAEERKYSGMTQKELGEKTGIDGATIGKYERGVLNPKIGTLRKIADALGCKVADLDSTLALSETVNEAALEMIPDLRQKASEMMKTLYGTSDKDEARQVVFSRWVKKLSEADRDSVYDVLKNLQKLNSEGKKVASERVEELTQILRYQRPAEDAQTAPGGADDKDPDKK